MDSLQQGSSFPPSTSLGDFKLVMNDVVAQGGADGLFEVCFIGAVGGSDLYTCYFSEPFVALYGVGLVIGGLEIGDWRLETGDWWIGGLIGGLVGWFVVTTSVVQAPKRLKSLLQAV